jgi:hypothetical protein
MKYRDIITKYLKYNVIGWVGFALSTLIFACVSPFHYWLAWLSANLAGGTFAFLVLHFKVNIHRSQ